MNNNKIIKSTIYLSLAVSLAACGGGGGGGGSGGGSSSGKLSLDDAGYAERKIVITEETAPEDVKQLYSDVDEAENLIEEARSRIELWPEPVTEDGKDLHTCENGGTAIATIKSSGWDDDEHWQFSDCQVTTSTYGPLMLNGTYVYVDKLVNETATSERWTGYENYNITGSILNTSKELTIKGQRNWDEHYRFDNRSIDSWTATYQTDALEFVFGDQYYAVRNATEKYSDNGSSYTLDLDGTLVSSAIEGYVRLSTPTPVTARYNHCPHIGVVRVESDGYVEFRYGSSAGPGEAVSLVINGQPVASYASCDDWNILD